MRFSALDGWRGVCAILVALLHFEAYSHLYSLSFFRNSALFVDFFFVLSGFVVTHAYAARLIDFGSLRDCMIRRIGRLWPLQVATLLFCLSLEVIRSLAALFGYPAESPPFATAAAHFWPIFRSLVLVQSLGFDSTETFNLPSWSISVEMYTYLLFGLFCLAGWRKSMVAAGVVALAGALALLLVSDRYLLADHFRYGIFRAVYGFFVGCVVYRIRDRHPVAAPSLGLAEIPVAALVVAFVIAAKSGPITMLAPPLFGAVVYLFSAEAGHLSRLLKSSPFQSLGRWSYSIYMVHSPIVLVVVLADRAIEKLFGNSTQISVFFDGKTAVLWSLGGRWGTDLAVLVYLALVVTVAAMTYRIVELPGQRLFNAFVRPRPPALVVAG
jgi:peptidoglycan/LPS O-acetylase OafA/YrhL